MLENTLRKYIIQRLLQLIPVLIGITFLSFAMMRVAGSDAVTEMYGDKGAVSQEIIDARRAELGLDRPFIERYFAWLEGFINGDLGISYSYRQPVRELQPPRSGEKKDG